MTATPASPNPAAKGKPPMTEKDIDALEAMLNSPALKDSALPLDALQGMLCAILSGPRLIAADIWLPVALGDTPRFANDAQADEADRMLLHFHDTVAAELLSDEGLSLILYPTEEGGKEFDFVTWCAGYLEGVDLFDAEGDTPNAEGDEEADQLLLPFLVLSGALDDDPELRAELGYAPADATEKIRHWKKTVVDCVLDAHDYWMQRRLTPPTFRNEEPKIGRNDPCHCGSGKKFKFCHGA